MAAPLGQHASPITRAWPLKRRGERFKFGEAKTGSTTITNRQLKPLPQPDFTLPGPAYPARGPYVIRTRTDQLLILKPHPIGPD